MSRLLVASTPLWGHLAPMLRVAGLLAEHHDVSVSTSTRYTGAVRERGLEHVPLVGRADFDDRRIDAEFPGRTQDGLRDRVLADVDDLVSLMAAQRESLHRAVSTTGADAILVDTGFVGAAMEIAMGSHGVPLVACGVLPLLDPGSHGLPQELRTLRSELLRDGFHRVLSESGTPGPDWSVDDWPLQADRFLQYSIPAMSDRTDPRVRFAGRVPTTPPPGSAPATPVRSGTVVVTRGTLDGGTDTGLWRQTVVLLAHRHPVLVAGSLDLPDDATNVECCDRVDLEQALVGAACLVTNGGFGTVQAALAAGVPVVVVPGRAAAGDKRGTAAFVRRNGAGASVDDPSPDPARIVEVVLEQIEHGPSYDSLAREYAQYDWATSTSATVAEVLDRRPL